MEKFCSLCGDKLGRQENGDKICRNFSLEINKESCHFFEDDIAIYMTAYEFVFDYIKPQHRMEVHKVGDNKIIFLPGKILDLDKIKKYIIFL